MNKFLFLSLFFALAVLLHAEDIEKLSTCDYAKLEERVFLEHDINALNILAVYNDYFSKDKDALLYSSILYYISANTNKPSDIMRSIDRIKKYTNTFANIKNPFEAIPNENIKKLDDGFIKDFLLSTKTGKAVGKMKKSKLNPDLFDVKNKSYKSSLPSLYALNEIEKKYYPLLALRGNTEVLGFLKIIAASSWADEVPKYPFDTYILLMYIDHVLTGTCSDFFKNIKMEKEIFSLNLPTTDFLEKDDNILSKFILYHRYIDSGKIQKAKEIKVFLEDKKVDNRLLKSYMLKQGKLVENASKNSAGRL